MWHHGLSNGIRLSQLFEGRIIVHLRFIIIILLLLPFHSLLYRLLVTILKEIIKNQYRIGKLHLVAFEVAGSELNPPCLELPNLVRLVSLVLLSLLLDLDVVSPLDDNTVDVCLLIYDQTIPNNLFTLILGSY